MSSKIFDMPRHKRPHWEVIAFAAALAGLVGLALARTKAEKAVTVKPSDAPAVTAEFTAP
jgi:hypothetical protein